MSRTTDRGRVAKSTGIGTKTGGWNMNGSYEKNQNYENHRDDEAFWQMMQRLEMSNAGQEKYARKQYRMSQVTAIASILVLMIVCGTCAFIIPKVNKTYENMEVVLEDLKGITSDLSEADLDQMIMDIDRLVNASEENVNQALEKIQAIDIDELNRAIKSLSDVVEPLGGLFNRFR